jgi:hypothetical protein
MVKKGDARASANPASPKRLNRKLTKFEARLEGAADKRDRAQARVDALTIMVDEVRAAIAVAGSSTSEGTATKPAATASRTAKATPKPATRRGSAGTSTTTRRRSTRAATTSTSTGRRRRPAGGRPPAASS